MSRFRGWRAGQVLFALAPGMVWWIAFSPATMTQDSAAIWSAVQEHQPIPEMPIAYWAYVSVLSLFGTTLGLVTLVQGLALAVSILLVCRALGLTRWAAASVTAIIMATPFGGLFAMALWKDVPATILMLLGATLIARSLVGNAGIRVLLTGAICLLLAGLMRFEAPLVLLSWALVLLVLAALQFRAMRAPLLRGAVAIGVAGAVSLVLATTLQTALVGQGLSPWFKWKPAIADLAYVAAMEPRDEGEPLREARLMVSGEALEVAKLCGENDTLFLTPGFDVSRAGARVDKIPEWWLRVTASYPHLVVRAHMCRGAPYLPPPFAVSAGKYPIWNATSILKPNEQGVEFTLPQAARVPLLLWNSLWVEGAAGIAWPGLLGLLGTVALVAMGRWNRARGTRIVFASCIWGTLLPFAAWTVLSDFRYVATAQILGLLAIVAFVAGLINSGSYRESEVERDRKEANDSQ